MHVLLTGGYGCIGAWIVRNLLGSGDRVSIYDLKEDPRRLRLLLPEDQVRQVRFLQGDVTDLPALCRALAEQGITHLVHLAGLQVPTCRADPLLGAQGQRRRHAGCLRGGTASRRAGAAAGLRQFRRGLRAAGRTIRPGPLADDVKLTPSTHYGYFKCCNEGNARVYYQDFGLSSVGLRPGRSTASAAISA